MKQNKVSWPVSKSEDRVLVLLIFAALIFRLLFFWFGASMYFPRENFMLDGDSLSWMRSIENLIKHGVYTSELGNEFGFFSRMPGYPFFIGIFYLLSGKDWEMAVYFIVYAQIILDVITVFLVYKIVKNISSDLLAGWIAAGLYAFYPFVVVWNPVVYAESVSVFFLLWGFYMLIKLKAEYKKMNLFFGGFLLGVSVLMRPQIALFVPIAAIYFLWRFKPFKRAIVMAGIFGLGIFFSYGMWPLRNIMIHQEIVLAEDLRAYPDYGPDVLAFRKYVYSLKSEWEPQFSQILNNEEVYWPAQAFISKEDSLLLMELTWMAQNCSEGFSSWRDYWGEPIKNNGCAQEVADGFFQLRQNQIRFNPLNYYVKVPFENLKKAFFKNNLTQSRGKLVDAMVFFLFAFRSFLIIAGLGFSLVLIARKKPWAWLPLLFFLAVYVLVTFFLRNVEMRYFLHADILLLFPLGIGVSYLINKNIPEGN